MPNEQITFSEPITNINSSKFYVAVDTTDDINLFDNNSIITVKNNFYISDVSFSNDMNKLTATATFTSSYNKNVCVVLASYDTNSNKLLRTAVYENEEVVAGTSKKKFDIDILGLGEASELDFKLFVWDGLYNQLPLAH